MTRNVCSIHRHLLPLCYDGKEKTDILVTSKKMFSSTQVYLIIYNEFMNISTFPEYMHHIAITEYSQLKILSDV